jgi:hypothetical protein
MYAKLQFPKQIKLPQQNKILSVIESPICFKYYLNYFNIHEIFFESVNQPVNAFFAKGLIGFL